MVRPTGIDISHWAGTIDWETVRKQPEVQFAIAKCSEGTNFLDSEWANNRAGCQQQKMPFGAYHFYRNNGDPVGQADYCISKLGVNPPFVVVCDVETTLAIAIVGEKAWRKGKLRGADEAAWQTEIAKARRSNNKIAVTEIEAAILSLSDDVKKFMERITSKGYKAVIYSSPGFMKAYFPNCDWLESYNLWIAHIGVTTPTIPYPYSKYGAFGTNPLVKIWQKAWDWIVKGIPSATDGNDWWNENDSLYDWFGNGEPYQEPAPTLPSYLIVNATVLNVRKSIYGTYVGTVCNGVCLKPFEKGTDYNGQTWYRIGTERWVAGWWCKEIYE